jgi:hypothetical protein
MVLPGKMTGGYGAVGSLARRSVTEPGLPPASFRLFGEELSPIFCVQYAVRAKRAPLSSRLTLKERRGIATDLVRVAHETSRATPWRFSYLFYEPRWRCMK